jgi:hypothetical protein
MRVPGRHPPRSRHELEAKLDGVGGWLDVSEAWALHTAVRDAAHLPTVVEIGSWKGRSTIALALGAEARGGGRVYAVDPHRGIARLPELGTSYRDFRRNIAEAGVEQYVTPMLLRSDQAACRFADRSVDVLFVDGSHVYEDVLTDLACWTTRLADGGVAAFHDATGYPGVRRAISERVLARSPFREPQLIDSTLLMRVRHTRPWGNRDEQAAEETRERLAWLGDISR